MALLQFSINNFNCSSALNFANHFISPTRSRHVFQYRKKKQTNSSLTTTITRCSSTSSSSSSVVISSLTSFILEQKQQTSDIDDNHSDELLQQDHDDELIVSREQAEEEDTEEEDEEHDSDGDEEVDDEEVEFVEEKRAVHEVWKQLQGCNDWEGLLDPMNSHMRNEILRYGELAQACYDSFDFDPHSKYCGTCKYTGAHFFEYLDMFDKGYHISRYLYATSNINLPNFFQKSKLSSVWSTHANWMGYVAVITDEKEIKRLGRRDILVAWRGTVTYIEWIYDLKDILCSANFGDDPSVKLELGFYDLYTKKEENCNYASFSAREQVLAEIKRLVERYKGEELSITFTGHSLGAALAILSAYDIAEMGLNVKSDGTAIPVSVFSFAGPRVGNLRFKERCDELGVKVLRVTNVHDKVPTVPGVLANEKFQYQKYLEEKLSFPWSYAHVGVELALDHTHSPFLKPTNDLVCAHNLEAHLHLVDGYHGKGRKFRLVSKRDVALVNKSCDFLKTKYNVPPFWKQDENKGMVKNSEGRWIMPERPRIDAHPPDTAHHLEQVLKRITSVASGENAGITSKQAF